jgi:hypothetical protein
MTDLPDDYIVPLKKNRTKAHQLHVNITTEAGRMLDALGTMYGTSNAFTIERLIRDTAYGKTLTAAERKQLWKLIQESDQEATR